MPTDRKKFRIITILKVIEESPSVKTFLFKDRVSYLAKPAQFLMVWIPRREELPLSVMISEIKDHAAITIRKHGYGSSSLYDMRKGDQLGIRGPYGNSFTIKSKYKKILLIGGGTGLVPLMRFLNMHSKKNIEFTLIIGSRTKAELFFEELIERLSISNLKIIITTEDGTKGYKGMATNALERLLKQNNNQFDAIYTCGPELMMKKIFDLSNRSKIPLQASLERYMKCGIGICSSCAIDDKLVCIDGTVFDEKQLSLLTEFGVSYRNKSGVQQKY